jgi:hypothetical protein
MCVGSYNERQRSAYEALGVLKYLTFNLLCRVFIFTIFLLHHQSPNALYTLLAAGYSYEIQNGKSSLILLETLSPFSTISSVEFIFSLYLSIISINVSTTSFNFSLSSGMSSIEYSSSFCSSITIIKELTNSVKSISPEYITYLFLYFLPSFHIDFPLLCQTTKVSNKLATILFINFSSLLDINLNYFLFFLNIQ